MDKVQDVAADDTDDLAPEEQAQAAQMIQRNYRGYRERRQLQGMGLDASARWAEVETTHTYWRLQLVLTCYRLYETVRSPHIS